MTTDNTPTERDSLKCLLQDLDSMRKTLTNFVALIKQQNTKINEQNDRIAILENKLDGIDLPNPEQIIIDRFTESSKHNRSVNEIPKRIALAAHLSRIKQIPNMRIAECGLMSSSKLHGLGQWDNQHLLDFCTLNHVMDIYREGLPDAEVKRLLPDDGYKKLMAYIEHRNTSGVDTK